MQQSVLQKKEVTAYVILSSLVICGLAGSLISGSKVTHFVVDFPFSNIIFSIFTFPIIDCICELWGKSVARQTVWLGLACQMLIAFLIQISIISPSATFWTMQNEYQTILSVSGKVIIASLVAFSLSQVLDILVYQRLKEATSGKLLWLRSNISTYLGQTLDSMIFVAIVFHSAQNKFAIVWGSILVKIILSLLMTPVVYLIIIGVDRYLARNTMAFKR